MDVREPAVANTFYPGSESTLTSALKQLMPKKEVKAKAIGLISPHAGYIYSGGVAGELISSVVIPNKVILIGPNHTGLGTRASIMTEGAWRLPNGTVPIDCKLANNLLNSSDLLTVDSLAHFREHSLEVQIPFLLHERKDLEIVPITVMGLNIEACKKLGHTIAEAVKSNESDILIVASSDMTHYESQKSAAIKDRKAIEKVLEMDAEGLLKVVAENDISMCGVIPATIMLFAARELGAEKATLSQYATSGDVSGDYDQVVGYAGMIVQ